MKITVCLDKFYILNDWTFKYTIWSEKFWNKFFDGQKAKIKFYLKINYRNKC